MIVSIYSKLAAAAMAATALTLAAPASATTAVNVEKCGGAVVCDTSVSDLFLAFDNTPSVSVGHLTVSTTGVLKPNGNGIPDLTITADSGFAFGDFAIRLNQVGTISISGVGTLLDGTIVNFLLDPAMALANGATDYLISSADPNALFTSVTLDFSGSNSMVKGLFLGDATELPTAAVPEPATWAMLVLGFGLVGAASRRRKVANALA